MNEYDQFGVPTTFRVPRDEFGYYRPTAMDPAATQSGGGIMSSEDSRLTQWRRNLDRAGTMMGPEGGEGGGGGGFDPTGLMRYINPQPGPNTRWASSYGRSQV